MWTVRETNPTFANIEIETGRMKIHERGGKDATRGHPPLPSNWKAARNGNEIEKPTAKIVAWSEARYKKRKKNKKDYFFLL